MRKDHQVQYFLFSCFQRNLAVEARDGPKDTCCAIHSNVLLVSFGVPRNHCGGVLRLMFQLRRYQLAKQMYLPKLGIGTYVKQPLCQCGFHKGA